MKYIVAYLHQQMPPVGVCRDMSRSLASRAPAALPSSSLLIDGLRVGDASMRVYSNDPAMYRTKISEKSAFLLIVTLGFHSFRVGYSVSLERREDGLATVIQDDDVRHEKWRVDKVVTELNTSSEGRPQSAALPEDPLPKPTSQELGETILDDLSWTIVDNRQPRSSASDSAGGYEADFTGWGYFSSFHRD